MTDKNTSGPKNTGASSAELATGDVGKKASQPIDGAYRANAPGGPGVSRLEPSPDARKPGESMAAWKARRSA